MSPILLISGTNRPGSYTLRTARIILEHYRRTDAHVELFDLQEMPAELFHPSSYAQKPQSWLAVQHRIAGAAGLHLVTPEYNGGFPGVLKYFIDMLKFPESFENKPVAFTGVAAGKWGAIRPVEQIQMIFTYRNAYVYPHRVFIPSVHERIKDDRLLDAEIDSLLASQAAGFAKFAQACFARS